MFVDSDGSREGPLPWRKTGKNTLMLPLFGAQGGGGGVRSSIFGGQNYSPAGCFAAKYFLTNWVPPLPPA